MIHRLLAEEEMLNVHTVAIVLNCRKDSKLYNEIVDKSQSASQYLKAQEEKAENDVDEEEEAQKREGSKKKKNISSSKENSIKEKPNEEFPFKSKFL